MAEHLRRGRYTNFSDTTKATLEGGSVKEFKSFIEARRKAAQNA